MKESLSFKQVNGCQSYCISLFTFDKYFSNITDLNFKNENLMFAIDSKDKFLFDFVGLVLNAE